MKKRVLLLGAHGMEGHVLNLVLREHDQDFEVMSVARDSGKLSADISLDVTNFSELTKLIQQSSFDVIINCIGILNKTAEDNPDLAVLINAYLPHFLEAQTKNTSCKVIHISTDCVFSGGKGNYNEKDFKDGKGFYAQSKALGEIENEKDLTIRTSIIGPELKSNGIGLFHWFMNQTGEIKGFEKAIWSGVTTLQLARSIVNMLQQQKLTGLVHLTNNQPISKYDLLLLIQRIFAKSDVVIISDTNYSVDKSIINTRKDFDPQIPSYEQMLVELRQWMEKHSHLYNYTLTATAHSV